MSPPTRVWFITGASTGFGYHLACHALDKGDTVVATMRDPSSSNLTTKHSSDSLLELKLDVTDAKAISDAFASAKAKYGRVDVVFNNAGSSLLCEFEDTPEEKARVMFDANFWGACNVMKEAIKVFRENTPPGGRLLQNSSSSALTCNPGVAFYGASKAALESVTESLAQELDPGWNIKITIFESGPFNTLAIKSNMPILPPAPPYSSLAIGANPTRLWISSGELYKIAGDPVKAVRIFYEVGTRDEVEGETRIVHRVVLHPVAVECAKTRIESMKRGVEVYEKEWKEWL